MTITEAELQKLMGRIEALEGDTKQHDAWINGNGKPGAKTSLELLSQRLKTVEDKLDDLTRTIRQLMITVGGAALVYLLVNLIPRLMEHVGP
jgi:hypothetical protein